MGQENYWNYGLLRSVIIGIPIVDGQRVYPLDSMTSNLTAATKIVGVTVREAAANATTLNTVTNQPADLVDATIMNGGILFLNNLSGANRQQQALENLTPRQADNWFYQFPPDNSIDLVYGKSYVSITASGANITANAGKVIELTVFYLLDGDKC